MTLLAEGNVAPPARRASLCLGFAGVGWIGRHRMEALLESGWAEAAAIAEPAGEAATAARKLAPAVRLHEDFDALLDEDIDGVVIATPSALHAEQAIRALEAGFPVFCQKPLGRTAEETRCVVNAARRTGLHLAVDYSYRYVEGARRIHRLVQEGAIGEVYAVDLVFHNAYGPDTDWYYDPARSGGGCVIDLGIHLVDLVLWTLGFPEVRRVASRLFAGGDPLTAPGTQVEDYATARLDLSGDVAARLACSWNLPAGREAVIEAVFYGTQGGLALRNVDGSFYDFKAEHFEGTTRRVLAEPPDSWGGRAAVAWAEQVVTDPSSAPDDNLDDLLAVAEVIDSMYDR